MVALLVPGVGEEHVHPGQRAGAIICCSTCTASCRTMRRLSSRCSPIRLQQGADAGLVHLDADEVGAGRAAAICGGGVAHAEADLQHAGRLPAEHARPGRAGVA